jgi:amidase
MLAFAGYVPPYEATLVKNLKAAGAIVIAKTGLTELAYWIAGPPSPIPGDYNAVGGFGFNPYDARLDPRPQIFDGRPVLSPGGSSSGIGTAASFWAANVGSDTGGSIISPANQMMLVGLRPTVGRISRYGIIPLTADHDTAGPMARSVTDAAILLGVLESASADPNDDATKMCTPPPNRDYTRYLQTDALKGKRIGVPRAYFYDPVTIATRRLSAAGANGLNEAGAKLMAEAISVLKEKGAVIVDPANLPSLVDSDPEQNFAFWGDYCAGSTQGKGNDANCSVNFKYGFKRDFNRWLETLGPSTPVKSLTELREWNTAHAKGGAIKYGQSRLDLSDEMDVEKDDGRNAHDNAKDILLSRTNGIEAALKKYNLDAIITPRGSGAAMAARADYPIINVPLGFVPVAGAGGQPFPEGFIPKPSPFGIDFIGTACSEPQLLGIAYSFEQASRRRVPPPDFP